MKDVGAQSALILAFEMRSELRQHAKYFFDGRQQGLNVSLSREIQALAQEQAVFNLVR